MAGRLPPWFKQGAVDSKVVDATASLLSELNLHTICESAICPNIVNCYSRGTATFLILGNVCTRNCRFCNVQKGQPQPVSSQEPYNILKAVEMLDLHYVVITSVTRDDLPDGGASQFASILHALRESWEGAKVEVLIPDLLGSIEALNTVMEADPSVINHNVETVPRLYPKVRPEADYYRSVGLLYQAKRIYPNTVSKSGIMLGLGEEKDEVIEVMNDLREADCDLLTIGQYLQPSSHHYPIVRFVHPKEFEEFSRIGRAMGFVEVASSPSTRSSFRAAEMYRKALVTRSRY